MFPLISLIRNNFTQSIQFRVLFIALAVFVFFGMTSAQAATFTVSNANDNGSGSLRQAILDANNAPGDDEIVFSGFFDSPRTITLLSGDLAITSGLTITGKGANLLTVSGNNQSRIFHVHTAATPVILSGMKITVGRADTGAGIWNGVNLTLNGVVVHDNDATITPAQGGGIYNIGTLTLNNSTVSSNYANDGCTGYNTSCATRNSGAGIYNTGTLNITNSIVSSNWATNRGGGIYTTGNTTITNSTISDNTVNFEGFDRVGGGIYTTSSLTITNSTISNNRAFNGCGGICIDGLNSSLPTRITNSTLVGNNTENNGGAISVGGCLNYNVNQCGALELTNSTVTGNFSNSTAAGEGGGGGIYCVSPHCRLNNSIVAGNSFGSGTRNDVYAAYRTYGSNAAFSGSYNLIGKGDGIFGLSDGTNNNQIGSNSSPIDPRFSPAGLQNNGGATKTIALRSNSPAIDKGNATGADQRGVLRPYDFPSISNTGNGADIGAFESGIFIVNSLSDTADNSAGDGTCSDGANCTLRAAIQEANAAGAGKINLNFSGSGMQTIQLATALPAVNGKITIAGPGADKLTIRRNSNERFRIFTVYQTVTISGITIANGYGEGYGGGVLGEIDSHLTLDGVVISGNRLYPWDSFMEPAGGGVYQKSYYALIVKNSTVSGNIVEGNKGYGGGVARHAGGYDELTVINSTVSGNAAQYGGGVSHGHEGASIINSTIAFNSANNSGGGLYKRVSSGTVNLKNSIVSNNTAPTAPDISGAIVSQGFNLVQNRAGNSGLNSTTDLPNGTNPRLNSMLAYNGGTTLTHALRQDSPAIDKGSAATGVTTDQRGMNRVDLAQISNNPAGGNGSDIGAFEIQEIWNTLTVTKTDDTNDNSCTAQDCSLREAVAAANATTQPELINFAIPTNDSGCNAGTGACTITLTLGSEIAVSNAGGTLTIEGAGADRLTINGGTGQNRIFYSGGANVTIKDMTLTGGNGLGAGRNGAGGAIFADNGTLILDGVHVTGNSPTNQGFGEFRSGGGVSLSGGNHQFINSTISGNTSGSGCAGFEAGGGTSLTIINSTISGNSASVGNGGGGCVNGGSLTLRNATVTGNSVPNAHSGGGIANINGALNLGNAIVAGNSGGGGPDLGLISFGGTATIATAGYNLIGNNAGVEAAFPAGQPNANNDRVGTSAAPLSPRLAPLGNYGGSIWTHALLSNSPAINTGDSALAGNFPTDQRGALRFGNYVDIGAFEFSDSFRSVLPTGRSGQNYNLTLAPNNNGLTYSITGGQLPPGLSLTTSTSRSENQSREIAQIELAPSATVAITGTPTTPGTYNFTVTATNGTDSVATNYQLIVASPPPTAASVTVGGRVLTADGRGIRNVLISMTDSSGQLRTVLSGPSGNYRFTEVEAGATYIFSVSSKRFRFSNPAQVRSIQEETDDIDFIADN